MERVIAPFVLAESGGDLDEAMRLAQTALHKSPGHPMLTDTLGFIYFKKNMSDSAVRTFQNLVQQVQSSPVWKNTAIIITFDTGGGWYDHAPPPTVDNQGLGSRVPTIVVSPYAKKNYVSHVTMDHVSVLKLIQWNWGLPSLNARNAASGDMLDLFDFPAVP